MGVSKYQTDVVKAGPQIPSGIEFRLCKRCDVEQPVFEFGKRRCFDRKSGNTYVYFQPYCRSCFAAYNKARKTSEEGHRRYYDRNRRRVAVMSLIGSTRRTLISGSHVNSLRPAKLSDRGRNIAARRLRRLVDELKELLGVDDSVK